MYNKIIIASSGILMGLLLGLFGILYHSFTIEQGGIIFPIQSIFTTNKQVIGFLPYWLIGNAKSDYSKYITTLTYFGLRIDTDGNLLKLVNSQEEEPGWTALRTGKLDTIFNNAKKSGIPLSLLVANSNEDSIGVLINDPGVHSKNLISQVGRVMHQYGFTDLNIDIESTIVASDDARIHFSQFIKEVKKQLGSATLTIEISPSDLINKRLINVGDIANIADKIVLMAYDYHYAGSMVTGPVAPLSGAGVSLEYDTKTAVQRSLKIIPEQKLVLGLPLYGYEWETLDTIPHAAVIPGTGVLSSNFRTEKLRNTCATCSAEFEDDTQESHLIYKDEDSGYYHQIFFPDNRSMIAKISFVEKNHLGGLALWALGYEDSSNLTPLESFK